MYNSVNQTLSLTNSTTGGLLDISEIRQIYYGNSATDLNLCSSDSYTYVIAANQTILLNSTAASFMLTHKTNRLPDLMVNLQLIGEQIVNFNIALANKSSSSRNHTAVDIGAVALNQSVNTSTLQQYVNLSAAGADFRLDVFTNITNLTNNQSVIVYTL